MIALCALLVALSTDPAPPTAAAAGVRVSGRVTDRVTNAPLDGVVVILFPDSLDDVVGPPPERMTDMDGRFAFTAVPPGIYDIDTEKPGYLPMHRATPSLRQRARVGTMAVDRLSLQLERSAVITGHLLDPNGQPMAAISIMALLRRDGPGTSPRLETVRASPERTNDLGEFQIEGLWPGDYSVLAVSRSELTLRPRGGDVGRTREVIATTYYPGTLAESAAVPIRVTTGALIDITFKVQSVPAFRVSGVVVDENGSPVANATVALSGQRDAGPILGEPGGARTAEDGRFDIDDVAAGSYRVNASAKPLDSLAQGPAFVVSDGDVTGIRIVVRRPPLR